jgi:F5/8 type C domain-containing protein/alpha-L-rhamnosidase-like protein
MSLALVLLALLGQAPADSAQILDDFENLGRWSALPSEGVTVTLRSDQGRTGDGHAMRLDFDFQGHGGYAIARRTLDLALPENYEFSFWIRGDARPNTLEFKLADSSGDNVWWYTRPSYEFPHQWQRVTIKRRHIRFAWGPAGGGELRQAATLELVITAAQGGAGSVWIDDLTFRRRDPDRPYDLTPRVTASSGSNPEAVLDSSGTTGWQVRGRGPQWLALDFLRPREYGGLILDWAPGRHATDYTVDTSGDGNTWAPAYVVRGGNGGRDYLYLPESETRYLRLRVERVAPGAGEVSLRRLWVEPVDWADSPTAFLRAVAADAPPGSYPRYFSNTQVYWTVLGASGDGRRGLLNEDGALETGQGRFSIEPFLFAGSRLLTWKDGRRTQSLERGDLPVPSVQWNTDEGIRVTVTAFAAGPAGASSLVARYRIRNLAKRPVSTTLFLALRPFQVNPPWQFLGTMGGAAPLHRVAYDKRIVSADSQVVVTLTPPAGFGASSLDRGDIVEHLVSGVLPAATQVTDSAGRASAALAYPLDLAPSASRDVWLEVPLYGEGAQVPRPSTGTAANAYGERRLRATVREWSDRLDRVGLELPASAGDLSATVKANLAYILINREGPAIEPGARSYRRSWIRDGAMISAALLRLGQADAVKAFLDWYAPFQYPNGKVPCCVDARGADPVPENDSHGQLIFLAMEYYRQTGDRATLERMWPHVGAAVGYIDSLRHSRMTPVYQTPESLAFRGLLPQSISHEGYSAKPMHSYWDDFYALKGLKDAADMAELLGKEEEHTRIAAMRDEFRRDLYASIERAMATHGIDFIPGSVELGDFDATSTTVAVAPVGELEHLPDKPLRRTFERYWEEFRARQNGSKQWEAYTPYELRTVGTLLRLGWKDRAHQALDWFFEHRRPAAWRHWAEVVWQDPATPKFIGDMPHTWVASDFLRSVLDFFAYERESDSALVVGDGIAETWVSERPGVSVRKLSTYYGPLSYSMRAVRDRVVVRIEGGLRLPQGGIVVRSPRGRPVQRATLNGQTAQVAEGRDVVVRRLPADLTLFY